MGANERGKGATTTKSTKGAGVATTKSAKKVGAATTKSTKSVAGTTTRNTKNIGTTTAKKEAPKKVSVATNAKAKEVKPKEIVSNIIDISNINLQEALGGAEIKVLHGVAKKSMDSYPIYTALINLGPVKVVKVRYTEDNWKSVKEKELSYEKSVKNDLEVWGTSIKLVSKSTDKFQYAISYEVNGMTYWDNNIGENHNF